MRTHLAKLTLMAALATITGCTLPQQPQGPVFSGEMAQIKLDQQDLYSKINRLQQGLQDLHDTLGEQQVQIETMQESLVAQKGTAAGVKTETMTTAPLPAPPPAQPPGNAPSPTKIYLQAFADYASNRVSEGIDGFETFLRLYPGSDYAGNAQYWLGECYFSQENFSRAADEFQKVVDIYPQTGKAPDALLKMAQALQRLNEQERALRTMQTLRELYPESAAAKKSLSRP
ncbi:MAG: tol-pal system protein YbgF [Desulfuromonas sp.]|uniref:tol-pal system protein YbgF n=1 Tax=Desulfuromonas sp. TaxID=892 RepID=UPI000CB022A1|nr:tol-pal system protein YbgF [Desulfuromonas sp.]PLX86620.1 MAG: tol-pal system protein YbgF [Desulfuromonas sp.]